MRVRSRTSSAPGTPAGLITLIDAAGLAAVVSAAKSPTQAHGVLPLGAAARLHFLAPARGRLNARCHLSAQEMAELSALYAGETARIKITTTAEIVDATDSVVCRGTFDWSIKTSRAMQNS